MTASDGGSPNQTGNIFAYQAVAASPPRLPQLLQPHPMTLLILLYGCLLGWVFLCAGDPHPGNIFAMADGRIAYVDFGNVAQLSQRNKEVSQD